MESQGSSHPKVSVIVPVFNQATYLPGCLDSILNQTLADIEVICIDDASTDSTPEILTRYAAKDSRIKCVRISQNGGPGPARNLGLSMAEGSYVQFTDGDDALPLSALELLTAKAIEDDVPLVRGSLCGFTSADPRLTVLSAMASRSRFTPLDEQDLWIPWWHHSYLISLDFLKIREITFPALRSGEDPVFLASVLTQISSMSSLEDVTYHYRLAPMETKNRANYASLRDYILHADMVRRVFMTHRAECWERGYGPVVRRDIVDLIEKYPLEHFERQELLREMESLLD